MRSSPTFFTHFIREFDDPEGYYTRLREQLKIKRPGDIARAERVTREDLVSYYILEDLMFSSLASDIENGMSADKFLKIWRKQKEARYGNLLWYDYFYAYKRAEEYVNAILGIADDAYPEDLKKIKIECLKFFAYLDENRPEGKDVKDFNEFHRRVIEIEKRKNKIMYPVFDPGERLRKVIQQGEKNRDKKK